MSPVHLNMFLLPECSFLFVLFLGCFIITFRHSVDNSFMNLFWQKKRDGHILGA